MLDELSLLIIASGLNILYGVSVLYGIYLGDSTNTKWWLIFAFMMIIVGLFIPLERLITQGWSDFRCKHSKLHFEKMHHFDISNLTHISP